MTEVSYFDVDVWGPVAENCSKYLTKGSGIIVKAALRQDRWEKDGKTQSRVRITANAVQFLPKKQNTAAAQEPAAPHDNRPAEPPPAAAASPEESAWEELKELP